MASVSRTPIPRIERATIAVLVIAIVSMVLSPGGDPYSMPMMLVPLVGLYFGGIALCKWLPSRRPRSVGQRE